MGDIISMTYHVNVPPDLFGKLQRQVERAMPQVLAATLEDGQTFVRRRFTLLPPSAPGQPPAIDTGNLYRHIEYSVDPDGKKGHLRANTSYAIYLEMGTRFMAARPFMLPAALHMRKRLPEIAQSYVRAGLGRV